MLLVLAVAAATMATVKILDWRLIRLHKPHNWQNTKLYSVNLQPSIVVSHNITLWDNAQFLYHISIHNNMLS